MEIHMLVWMSIFYFASALRELPYITTHKDANGERVYEIKISQPQVKVYEADQYFCFSKYLEELGEVYVLSQFIEVDQDYIHHVSMGFCDEPEDFANHGPWECSQNRDKICPGRAISGLFVDDFAQEHHGFMEFPKDVSLRVGSLAHYRYLTYESHFKTAVTDPTHPLVNITLTFTKSPTKFYYQNTLYITSGNIPANMDKGYFAEVACPWSKPEVVAFGVQLHTHHFGYMAEIFRIRNGTWTLLANHLTQGRSRNVSPVIGGLVDIKPGDIVAAKCLYINKGDNPVKFGLSDGEEMCNADIDFGYEPKDEEHFTRTGMCITNVPEFSFCDHEKTAAICGKYS